MSWKWLMFVGDRCDCEGIMVFFLSSYVARKKHAQIVAALGILFVNGGVEDFSALIDDGLSAWIRSVRPKKAGKYSRFYNVNQLLGAANARMSMVMLATARVVAIEIAVLPADLVGGVVACFDVVLL